LGISFGSINSGLPKDIVQQLIAAEKIPLQQMEARKAKVENKQALVKQLTGLVEAMKGDIQRNKGARSMRELKVQGGSDSIQVTADKTLLNQGSTLSSARTRSKILRHV